MNSLVDEQLDIPVEEVKERLRLWVNKNDKIMANLKDQFEKAMEEHHHYVVYIIHIDVSELLELDITLGHWMIYHFQGLYEDLMTEVCVEITNEFFQNTTVPTLPHLIPTSLEAPSGILLETRVITRLQLPHYPALEMNITEVNTLDSSEICSSINHSNPHRSLFVGFDCVVVEVFPPYYEILKRVWICPDNHLQTTTAQVHNKKGIVCRSCFNFKPMVEVEGLAIKRLVQQILVADKAFSQNYKSFPQVSILVELSDELVIEDLGLLIGSEYKIYGLPYIELIGSLIEGKTIDAHRIIKASLMKPLSSPTSNPFSQFNYSSLAPSQEPSSIHQYVDRIVNSFCIDVVPPRVFQILKLALLLALVSRSESRSPSRGSIHILVVFSEPIFKDQIFRLLKHASLILKHTTLSQSGTEKNRLADFLPKTQKQDSAIDCGVFSMAKDGVCFIEDLSAIKTSDINSLFEVMEKGELTVNHVEDNNYSSWIPCSVFAGCSVPLKKLKAHSKLVNRFDLIFDSSSWLCDKVEELIVSHILDIHLEEPNLLWTEDVDPIDETTIENIIHESRTWQNPFFVLPDAEELITNYYIESRRMSMYSMEQFQFTISHQKMGTLSRIAAAHAKLCFRSFVNLEDVLVAIMLVEESLLCLFKATPIGFKESDNQAFRNIDRYEGDGEIQMNLSEKFVRFKSDVTEIFCGQSKDNNTLPLLKEE